MNNENSSKLPITLNVGNIGHLLNQIRCQVKAKFSSQVYVEVTKSVLFRVDNLVNLQLIRDLENKTS